MTDIFKFLIVFIGLSLSSILGCTDNSTNSNSSASVQLIPLALNNSWIYKTEFYDSTGAILSSRVDTLRITGDTLINNETWYIFNNSTYNRTTNRSDGYYSYYDAPQLEYKYPAQIGDTILFSNSLKREVISTNTLITISNVSHSAYHYHDMYVNNVTDLTWDIFIAPKVGQVRVNAYRKNSQKQNYLTMCFSLMSYKLY